MELLVCLCARAGQVVPKQDLLHAVWDDRFVSDETVKGCFYQLRKILGDNPRRPRFIETLPKRGYRMLVEPVPLEDAAPPTSDADDLYQKGRAALSGSPNLATLKQARLYFERAVQSDPDHAEALAALAGVYMFLVGFGQASGAELWPRAKAAAARAAELSPNLAEAHLAGAVVRFVFDHDFADAELAFRRALDLKPSLPLAHGWYARFLSSQGRHAEAIAEARRELENDPLSLIARRELLQILFMARRYEETEAEAQHLFDILPGSAEVQLGMVWLYCLQRKDQQAFDAYHAGLQSMGVAAPLLDRARAIFAAGGLPAILRTWAELLQHEASLGQRNQFDLLALYALLGEGDQWFSLAEQAIRDGNPFVMWLAVSPLFDGLRGDPRFAPLLERLGFSPNLFPTSKPLSA